MSVHGAGRVVACDSRCVPTFLQCTVLAVLKSGASRNSVWLMSPVLAGCVGITGRDCAEPAQAGLFFLALVFVWMESAFQE